MGTDRREFERIEQIIYRSTGDIAEAIGRGLERLEERMGDTEVAIVSRIAELEERLSLPAVGSAV
jgi:hypothetical protein